jgi:hypothetical protein
VVKNEGEVLSDNRQVRLAVPTRLGLIKIRHTLFTFGVQFSEDKDVRVLLTDTSDLFTSFCIIRSHRLAGMTLLACLQ